MGPRSLEEHRGLLSPSEDDIELVSVGNGSPAYPSLLKSSPRHSKWFSSFRQTLVDFLKIVTTLTTHINRKNRIQSRRRSSSASSAVRSSRYRTCRGWCVEALLALLVITCILVVWCTIFFPSYSRPPAHYRALRRRVEKEPARKAKANVHNEKIFIAASLYDPGGQLVSGDWADSVRGLIHILGPWNVHLSIYENDVDDKTKTALAAFEKTLLCNKTIVEEDIDISTLPHVTTWDGRKRLKRMQFLADVRNRALRPLQNLPTHFDKLLYINDVVFDPVDAANLLFSTNVDRNGRTQYRAACAVDFLNPFKFYDTFATRDAQGYDMGVIFYPWFTGAGDGASRRDVLAQKDAVRVTSCWGGMVAFEAKWFQDSHVDGARDVKGIQLPLRFRAENDTYWDASECCLIHADLTALSSTNKNESGILMNPYIRVAYSKAVLDWLWVTRKFERLYTPTQSFVNWLAGRPTFNPRRLEEPGQQVVDRVWVWSPETQEALRNGTTDSLPGGMQGEFQEVAREALPGSFCGYRSLSYLLEDPGEGGKKWSHEKVPEGA